MIAFGPIAHVFGNEPTLLVAAGVACATSVVVAFVPGVHAVAARRSEPLEPGAPVANQVPV